MKLTPDDLVSRVFSSRVLGGYSPREVSDFLARAASEMEELIQEKEALKAKIKEKDSQLLEYKGREDLLKEAITTAQKTTAKMEEDARQTAHEVVQEAHKKADLIVQDARDSLKTVYQDLSDLRRVHIQMKNTLKAVLQSHQDLLEQDPIHTLLPQTSISEDEVENKVSQALSELAKTKDLL